MLSTVTLGDLGDLRAGFNAAVSGAAGSGRRGRLTWIFTDLRLQPARVATPGHGPQAAASLMAASNLAAVADLGPKRRRAWDPSLPGDAPGPGGGGAGAGLDGTAAGGRGERRTMGGGSCRGRAGGDFVAQLWGAPARLQLSLSLGRSRAEAGGERRPPPPGFPVSGREREESSGQAVWLQLSALLPRLERFLMSFGRPELPFL